MLKLITAVRPGETIDEGPRKPKTLVKKLEVAPDRCKNKVHVNDKDCWEPATMVKVLPAKQIDDEIGVDDFYND